MTSIKVSQKEENSSGWLFDVTVSDDKGESSHTVKLSMDYFKELRPGEKSPENLIKDSFEFLLERESKESILSEFDLSVISKYFPEYEKEIKKSFK